jgi:hypothetical protein
MKRSTVLPALVLLGGALVAAGCSDDDPVETSGAPPATRTSVPTSASAPVDPGDGGHYDPRIDPADFVATIDNPYLPFPVGARWVYEGTSDGEAERVVVEVTGDTRQVMGITATVVRDRVYVDDELVEDTLDWFAQDVDGNVWYLGEAVEDYEDGVVVSTEGSWEAGVDGALPGIVMPAAPHVGDAYRQELYAGEAEDMFEILSIDTTRTVPAGDFADVVVTEDWNPLDPDVIEEKSYAAGVGMIYEEHTTGGDDVVELVELTMP